MAKFKVLRPIELDGTLYLPQGERPPATPKSCSNGADIPVNMAGILDLTPAQATQFDLGQIQAIGTQGSAASKQQRKADS